MGEVDYNVTYKGKDYPVKEIILFAGTNDAMQTYLQRNYRMLYMILILDIVIAKQKRWIIVFIFSWTMNTST
nr:MAG: hypothetical protein [Bacteriophage sp.]